MTVKASRYSKNICPASFVAFNLKMFLELAPVLGFLLASLVLHLLDLRLRNPTLIA